MLFLNMGCGNIFIESSDWVNIDISPHSSNVKMMNLEKKLDFPDFHFDLVYSSHFIEHIQKENLEKVIQEIFRVLKPTGIARIVVPDFEEMARAYIKYRDSNQHLKADFVQAEILDQCVRKRSGGELTKFYNLAIQNKELKMFIQERNGHLFDGNVSYVRKINLKVIIQALIRRINRGFFNLGTAVMPRIYRESLVSRAYVGELHQWVYDFHNLEEILKKAGFGCVERKTASTSFLGYFPFVPLDLDQMGNIRKGKESMYIEAVKP